MRIVGIVACLGGAARWSEIRRVLERCAEALCVGDVRRLHVAGAVVGEIAPRPATGADRHLELRWTLGVPPTAAVFRSTLPGDRRIESQFLPRGAWGADAEVLREELTRRNDWRSLLPLDGTIPGDVAARSVESLDADVKGPIHKHDALAIVTQATPPGAERALRALLGTPKCDHDPEVWDALARVVGRGGLADLAEEMLRRAEGTPIGRNPESRVAHGFITALVLSKR